MNRRTRDAVFQLTGAVVGAGFASGREIMRFFSRYGAFSWIGVGLAALTMGAFALGLLSRAREADVRSLSQLSRAFLGKAGIAGSIAFSLLLAATGGSMLAASGELGSLALPIRDAYWIALLLTLAMALFFSRRDFGPLAWTSKLLVPVLILIFGLCLILPRQEAAAAGSILPVWRKVLEVCLGGIAYGSLNITLAAGVACEVGRSMPQKGVVWTSVLLGLTLLTLLSLGNAAFLKHPELTDAPLPMVMLLRNFGKAGYWLALVGLYLAVLTTLLAVTRGFLNIFSCYVPDWQAFLVTAVLFLLFAVIGFVRLVGVVYPVLGFLCLFLLLWIMTSPRKTDQLTMQNRDCEL